MSVKIHTITTLKKDKRFYDNISSQFIKDVILFNDQTQYLDKNFTRKEPLFYEGVLGDPNLISIDRKVLQKISDSGDSFLDYPSEDKIKKGISRLTGGSENFKKYNLLELKTGIAVGRKTILRQDFTCFCCRYFFTNNGTDPFKFYNKFLMGDLIIDGNLSISSTISDFNKSYPYPNVFEDLLDSVATAITIKNNAKKIKLTGLADYIIAEESSAYGKDFKQKPYDKIKSVETNYYSAADKMTTADIFLYNVSNRGSGQKAPQDYYSLINHDSDLRHNTFVRYMNKCMARGYIVPISLKKLTSSDIDSNSIATNKISVVNIASPNSDYVDDIIDPFLRKVVELLSINDKGGFVKEMEKVIDIKEETIKLNMYGTRATFDFDAVLVGNKKETYDVFIQNNQIYIKPPGSTSNSGLGGVTLSFIKKEIMSDLPKQGKFLSELISHRRDAFKESFNNTVNIVNNKIPGLSESASIQKLVDIVKTYKIFERKYKKIEDVKNFCLERISYANKKDENTKKAKVEKDLKNKRTVDQVFNYMMSKDYPKSISKPELLDMIKESRVVKAYKEYPLLKLKRVLSPSEYKKMFETLRDLPSNERDRISIEYVQLLESKVEKSVKTNFVQGLSPGLFTKKGEILSTQEREELIYSKLSTMEFLYYIGCDNATLRKWIKNAVIMGIYGAASASGVIVLNGKHIKLGKFGKDAIKRRNAMYVKIGR